MEVPDELKELYKHWTFHTILPKSEIEIQLDSKIIDEIIVLVNERQSIFEKKSKDESKPYTTNPVLSKYRFCNVYRELDRQTIYYHKLLKPLENDFSLWLLNMLFCRSICKTETIDKIGLLSFDEINNSNVYKRLLALDSPKYGNAYLFPISIIQKTEWNTREKLFCCYYPTVISKISKKIETFNKVGVSEAINDLLPLLGFNIKFLITELLIDVAYQYPQYIDLFKQFPIGPGSIPTMKRLNSTINPEIVNLNLTGYINRDINYLTYNNCNVYLSAENWEGIGCEFRKYTNLVKGTGRKRYYR